MSHRGIWIVVRFLGLWLVGALTLTIPISQINLVRFYRLRHNGVRTFGVVTELQPYNHQSVYYEFQVAGRSYSRVGWAGFGNPEFDRLAAGKSLIVYYLPADPYVSCSGIPDKLMKNEASAILGAGVVFPPLFIVYFAFWSPRFRGWLLCKG